MQVGQIRHGESEDNPKGIWAGWKDAPLSALGRTQAKAVGKGLSETRFNHIYASPLLRAYATGRAVHDAQPEPQPSFTSNPKLREQCFGTAEGHPWILEPPAHSSLQELFDKDIYPVLRGRDQKFPKGESLDDLARRAEEAIAECILPHLEDGVDNHIALASHGLCISELVAALLRLDPNSRRDVSYAGLLNTAWTRAIVSLREDHVGPIDPSCPPPLRVHVTDINNADHLVSVPTVVGDTKDANQAQARAYFGGRGRASSINNANIVMDDHKGR